MKPDRERSAPVAPGKVREVTAITNPLVKEIRALALKKYRDQSKRFVAEGLKLVTDALQKDWPIHFLAHAKSASEQTALQQAAARARARGATILETTSKVLGAITRRDNPQTVIGVFSQRWLEVGDIRPSAGQLWIGLDRVRDPGNLGTILRTADAFGASGVILIGDCTDPFSLEAVRATMGSIFHVPLARATEQQFLQWRAGWPGIVAGTHLSGASDFRKFDFGDRPALLLMGNEQQGLTPALAGCCDALLRIPMAGEADSLNLAVATALVAFEIRQRHLPPISGGTGNA